MPKKKKPFAFTEATEKLLLETKARVQAEVIDPVKKFLQDKALFNVQSMQEDADKAKHPLERFQIRKYLVGLAGYTEKQSIEHSGIVKVSELEIDV